VSRVLWLRKGSLRVRLRPYRLDAVESRLDAVESRLDAVESRLDAGESPFCAMYGHSDAAGRSFCSLYGHSCAPDRSQIGKLGPHHEPVTSRPGNQALAKIDGRQFGPSQKLVVNLGEPSVAPSRVMVTVVSQVPTMEKLSCPL